MSRTKKIDISKLKEDVSHWIEKVSNGKSPSTYKTKSAKALVSKIKKQLNDADLSLNYYRTCLTDLRNVVRDSNQKHHTTRQKRGNPNTIPSLKMHHKRYADDLSKLVNIDNDKVEAAINDLKNKIKNDDTYNVEKANQLFGLLGELRIFPEIFYLLKPNAIERDLIAENRIKQLEKKKTNTIKLSKDFIDSTIKDLLNEGRDNEYTALAFGLALASGRRATEILFTAEFKYINNSEVEFTGQLKRRAGITAPAYKIPLLIDSETFLKAFFRLRQLDNIKELNELENTRDNREEVNATTVTALNDRAKFTLSDRDRTFKDSRAIYTRYCLEYIRDKNSRNDEDHYVKNLLGHTSYAEQAHYKQFIIANEAVDMEGRESLYREELRKQKQARYERAKKRSEANAKEAAKAATTRTEKKAKADISKMIEAMGAKVDGFIVANPSRKRMRGLHDKIANWVINNPNRQITLTALQKKERGGIGGNRKALHDYLELVDSIIKDYNQQHQ